ncbi:armadillo-type protein [Daldinia eschscholtzii]|nr:armadillo-type protein [Daldinia eschscholtzii]
MGRELFIITLIILLGIASSYTLFRPLRKKIRRRMVEPRLDGIMVHVEPKDAIFEIVAVHGLGAHPKHTWEGPGHVHLLQDLLPKSFPQARISSFAYNSDWLVDAPIKSSQSISERLLEELQTKRQSPRLPIIFIGHSFGGIVIKKALSLAQCSEEILEDTCGIIYLGTPHQGSSMSLLAAIIASWTSFLGSDSTLLLSLRSHGSDLSDLEQAFKDRISRSLQKTKVVSFYETKSTYILRGRLSVGLIVDRDSASSCVWETGYMDTNHSGLNKFRGLEDEQYIKLKDKIDQLWTPPKFEEAYKYICDNSYTKERLEIKRLSGESLPLDQCYINLTILKHHGSIPKTEEDQSSQFSLSNRLSVKPPPKELQVELPALFNPRKLEDGSGKAPRRILIRGRAGVGKTTLCKKIVHDFVYNNMWASKFDYVFWISLRELNEMKGKKLDKIFSQHYFYHKPKGSNLAKTLWSAIDVLKYERCLFILDGLDEASGLANPNHPALILLDKPNVIITSRPHAQLPNNLKEPDLELDTFGFHPDQVQRYIENVVRNQQDLNEIRLYIQGHELIQTLVRIPIQLDALCYAKDKVMKDSSADSMTSIYEAITQHLWEKDVERLEKATRNDIDVASKSEIDELIKAEMEYLEHIAFNGMYNGVIEFGPEHQDKVRRHIKLTYSKFPLHERLGRLSFLRSSGYLDRNKKSKRNYHFLHLTFQEFFAAKYIVRKWKSGALECLDFQNLERSHSEIDPKEFFRRNKYNARYDIVWRFTAGLLGDEEIQCFFNLIEQEPCDLLGSVHQRLVMHCLSEMGTSTNLQCRPALEEKLTQWALFECNFAPSSSLIGDPEFPDSALINALKKASTSQKWLILNLIGRTVRRLSTTTLRTLETLLTHENDNINTAAIWARGRQLNFPEQAITDLHHVLASKNINKWAKIIGSIQSQFETTETQFKLPEKITRSLLKLIQERDGISSTAAAQCLRSQSELPDDIITTLVESFEGADDVYFQDVITDVLENQSILSKETIITLTRLAKMGKDSTRSCALRILAKQRNLPEETVLHIMKLLVDAPWDIRKKAAKVLAYQSRLSRAIETILTELAKDSDPGIQYAAAIASKVQSNLPERTTIAMAELINDDHRDLIHHIGDALEEQLNLPEGTILTLITCLHKVSDVYRYDLIRVLNAHLKFSAATTGTLLQLIEDEDWEAQKTAMEILERRTDLPEDIIKTLITLLRSKRARICENAARILENQPQLSEEIILALVPIFKEVDSYVRGVLTNALRKESTLSESCITHFTELLGNTNEDVQYAAAMVLIGKSNLPDRIIPHISTVLESRNEIFPEGVMTVLQSMLKDKEGKIRSEVNKILQKQESLSENNTQGYLQLLQLNDDVTLTKACSYLGRQVKLSNKFSASLVALLANAEQDTKKSISKFIARERNILKNVLGALGFQLEGKKEIETSQLLHIPYPMYIRSLYGTMLFRSFEEHTWMEVKDNSKLCIHLPSGTRTGLVCIQSKDQVLDWRRPWGFPEL